MGQRSRETFLREVMMTPRIAAALAFSAGVLATGNLYAQGDLTDLLDDAQDADLLHRSPRAPAPPPPGPGSQSGGPGGTFGGVIVSGLEAGEQPTESISLNGRPGQDSGGELPGQCPLCGVDGQGTDAQGAAPILYAADVPQKGKSAEHKSTTKPAPSIWNYSKGGDATRKAPPKAPAGQTTKPRQGLEANGARAQGAARD